MKQIDNNMNDLKKELKSQRNKGEKFKDIKIKENIFDLMKQKIKLLKSKFNDEGFEEEEIEENNRQIQNLEEFLKKSQNLEDSTHERELNEEQKDKMNEWKKREKLQDEKLEVIGRGVGKLKDQAIMAGEGIKEIGKRTKKTGEKIDETENNIKTQNERVKELINKLRSSDKICCDIVLILLLLGLICVLYSIIKHKYIK